MANRAALLFSSATPPADGSASVSYVLNNGAALFWYAAFGAEDIDAVGEGVWEARWRALLVDEPDAPALAAVILWTPWSQAEARLSAAAARLATLPPALLPPWYPAFMAWRSSLIIFAAEMSATWIGLDMVDIFALHEEPAEMLRSTLEGIAPWRGTGPIVLEIHSRAEELTGYTENPRIRPPGKGWPLLPGETPASARPIRRPLRRPGAQDWLLLASLAMLVLGAWITTGSIMVTVATFALLAFGFIVILRGPG